MGKQYIDLIFNPDKKTEIDLFISNIQTYDFLNIFEKMLLRSAVTSLDLLTLIDFKNDIILKSDVKTMLLHIYDQIFNDAKLTAVLEETLQYYLKNIASKMKITSQLDLKQVIKNDIERNCIVLHNELSEHFFQLLSLQESIQLSNVLSSLSSIDYGVKLYEKILLHSMFVETYYSYADQLEENVTQILSQLSERHVRYRLLHEISAETLYSFRNVAMNDLYYIDLTQNGG